MRMLSLCPLSVLPCSPLEQIDAAHVAGFDAIGLRLWPTLATDIDIMGDASLRRAIQQRLRNTGVRILEVDVVRIGPDTDVTAFEPVLEYAGTLGARSVSVTGRRREECQDGDEEPTLENLKKLCELASGFSITPMIEFMAYRGFGSLEEAVRAIELVDHPSLGVCVDVLHLVRSGGSAPSLRAVDPRLIGCIQLCDAPAASPEPAQIPKEARFGRLYPGEGDLPLVELLTALPADTPVGIEAPSQLRSGLTVYERADELARLTRNLLSEAELARQLG